MSEIAMYIMVIAALGIGVMVVSRRFLRRHQPKEYTHKTQRLTHSEQPLSERIDFRNKGLGKSNSLPERHYSFRDTFNRKTRESNHLGHTDLNKNFWMALLFLLSLIGLVIYL